MVWWRFLVKVIVFFCSSFFLCFFGHIALMLLTLANVLTPQPPHNRHRRTDSLMRDEWQQTMIIYIVHEYMDMDYKTGPILFFFRVCVFVSFLLRMCYNIRVISRRRVFFFCSPFTVLLLLG